ncbi:MAG: DUF3747 domain-containing protein [Prochloraceae cyanobacterium]|nr:DUF3747 domain-containing protein [Prochloraceae cyanobacterium]
MKLSLPVKLLALATTALASMLVCSRVEASVFGEENVDENQIIAVAAPYGYDQYNLLVIEQIPDGEQCWSESGSNPVMVEPLLVNFDFTGHCRRSVDSNGYSVRIDGQDYSSNYLLRIIKKDGELHLVGSSRNPSQPDIIIGETNGLEKGFMEIVLNPGWHFSKRTFDGRTLGHVYFSGNSQAIGISQDSTHVNSDRTDNSFDSSSENAIEIPVEPPADNSLNNSSESLIYTPPTYQMPR